MAIGKSGKVLIEIEPDLKKDLYVALRRDGLTMKGWFLKNAAAYLATRRQPELGFEAQSNPAPDRTEGR